MNRKVLPFVTTNMIRMVTGLAVMFLIASCGSNRTADTRTDTAPATGSVAFTVEWEPPQASPNASPAKGFFLQPMAPVIDVCSDYGIANMTMQVLSGQTVLVDRLRFPVTNHGATLNNVPASSNLTLHLIGSVRGRQRMERIQFPLQLGCERDQRCRESYDDLHRERYDPPDDSLRQPGR